MNPKSKRDPLKTNPKARTSRSTALPEPGLVAGRPETRWPKLVTGTLLKRYKRFLADVELSDGRQVTAHCPNSGAMTGCSEPGRRVYLSHHDNPRRKLAYTWEMIHMPTSLVGVNTLLPNRLVAGAIAAGEVPPLAGYDTVTREVRVGQHSRLDLRLGRQGAPDCYVEIKNCSLVEDGTARFPDAKTTRGLKHLRELEQLADQGHRCVIFFLVQRMDAHRFSPADRIDPAYGSGLRQAADNGVEIQVFDVLMDLETIRINRPLPYFLDP